MALLVRCEGVGVVSLAPSSSASSASSGEKVTFLDLVDRPFFIDVLRGVLPAFDFRAGVLGLSFTFAVGVESLALDGSCLLQGEGLVSRLAIGRSDISTNTGRYSDKVQ